MPQTPHGRGRLAYVVLAYVCVALGFIGIVLPLVPTTPFLLVAAWAASRGSPRLEAWLHNHPRLGPPLRAWREQGAVPTRAKILAVGLLTASWAVVLIAAPSPWLPVALGVLFAAVALYVCTRPAPKASSIDP